MLVNLSYAFLSAVFGIFGKFCFDIDENSFEKIFDCEVIVD